MHMEMPSNNPATKKNSTRKSWLPSRRVGWTLIILIVVFFIIILGTTFLPKLLQKKPATGTTLPAPTQMTERDTDGDGLPDWQEILFRLDPEKKDSNDDGIDDKTEFDQIRALAKNPAEIDQKLQQATDEDKISLIISDKIGKAIVAGKTDTEIQVEIATTIKEYVQAQIPAQVVATLIIQEESAANISAYFAAIDPVIAQTNKILEETAQYITETSISAPETFLSKIEALATTLESIPVPGSLEALHRSYIDALLGFRTGFVNPIELREGNEFQVYARALVIQTLGERVSTVVSNYVQVYQSIKQSQVGA